jgi:hypothetical protein
MKEPDPRDQALWYSAVKELDHSNEFDDPGIHVE